MPSKYRKHKEKERTRFRRLRASEVDSMKSTNSKRDLPDGHPVQPITSEILKQSVSESSLHVSGHTSPDDRHPTANSALVSISESGLFTATTRHRVLSGEIHIEALDEFSVLAGLIPPQTLYYAVLSGSASLKELEIDESVFAVQIHYITGHYVVSHQNELGIFVFDSLPYSERVVDLLPQLLLLYKQLRHTDNPVASIQYKISQLQGNTNGCGVFAAANAINLLRSMDPCSVVLDTAKLRTHLYNCLVTKKISPFPSISTQVSVTPWMSQYFTSQLSKDALRKQQQRSLPSFRTREQSRDSSRHAKRRMDGEYRASEQKRNVERQAARRLDTEYREAEKSATPNNMLPDVSKHNIEMPNKSATPKNTRQDVLVQYIDKLNKNATPKSTTQNALMMNIELANNDATLKNTANDV